MKCWGTKSCQYDIDRHEDAVICLKEDWIGESFTSRSELPAENVRFVSAYLQTGLFCPWLDWRPLIRLSVRASPALLALPPFTLPSLLIVRPEVEVGLVSVGFGADEGRCFELNIPVR